LGGTGTFRAIGVPLTVKVTTPVGGKALTTAVIVLARPAAKPGGLAR
jgi:hypothetical protein